MEQLPAISPLKATDRQLSYNSQGTPVMRKFCASPRVMGALHSGKNGSLNTDNQDISLDLRIARQQSSESIELLRIPEDRQQQTFQVLEDAAVRHVKNESALDCVLADLVGKDSTHKVKEKHYQPVVVAHSNKYEAVAKGDPNSFEHRVFLLENENDKFRSYWHDVPLDNGDGTVNFICEIPKGTKAKMEVATKEELTPIKQDVKKNKLREYPYPIHWNYGMLPQTWEDPSVEHEELKVTGDNDPVDVVEIGSKQLTCGSVYKVKVLGAYAMVDEGELDWKILAINVDDPLADQLNDIDDIERHMEGALEEIMLWFRDYKIPDGKPQNKFGFDNQPQNCKLATQVIQETHTMYNNLVQGVCLNTGELALPSK